MDTATFNQVLDLIQMLVIVLAMTFIYRSVPPGQLERLILKIESNAKQTPTPVDDTMAGFLRLFAMLVTGQQPVPATPDGQPQPVPMTVTGTMTASPAPSETAPTVEVIQTSAG